MKRISRWAGALAAAGLAACAGSSGSSTDDATPDPVVATTTIPPALVGTPYSAALATTGGRAPLTFALVGVAPSLAWLTVDPATGALGGTPTAVVRPGASFQVRVTDARGLSGTRALDLEVHACADGASRSCAWSDGAVCRESTQACAGGDWPACAGGATSLLLSACGPGAGSACGTCDLATADACTGGTTCACGLGAACTGAESCCGGSCTDTRSNPLACGSCGNACSGAIPPNAQDVCVAGVCGWACLTGHHACSGSCLSDTSTDSCGTSCAPCATHANATATCVSGTCGFTCDAGFDLCGGSCVAAVGPQVVELVVETAGVVVGSDPWFSQSGADVVVRVLFTDGGCGVDAATLALRSGTTLIDAGATVDGTNALQFRFGVPRVNAAVAAGAQALLALSVTGSDPLGHAIPAGGANSARLGIDGAPPVVTFDPAGQYPVDGQGCATTSAYAESTLACGHDGAHFWRRGDDGATLALDADDGGGSGVAATGCSVPGQGACAPGSAGGTAYTFTFSPSVADVATDPSGVGTVQVTVTAADRVGNIATVGAPVGITRVRWIRSFTGTMGSLRAPPALTPAVPGPAYLLLPGQDGANGSRVLQLASSGQVVGVSAPSVLALGATAVAYSPVSQRAYAAAGNKLAAFGVGAGGTASAFTCDLGASASIVGAPVILGSSQDRVFVVDGAGPRLWAFGSTGGTACNASNPSVLLSDGVTTFQNPGPPTTDNSTLYLSYRNGPADKGGVRVPWSGAFGAPARTNLASGMASAADAPWTSVALTSTSALLGTSEGYVLGTSKAYAQAWAPVLVAASGAAQPIVAGGLVYAAAAGSGPLKAIDLATGAAVFEFTPGTGTSGAPPAVGAEASPVLYVPAGTALDAIVRAGASWSRAAGWGAALSAPMVGGVALPAVDVGEPLLAPDGTLYFGTANGRIYAVWTDSAGAAVPGTSTWPRSGFDRCNSANSFRTNCP